MLAPYKYHFQFIFGYELKTVGSSSKITKESVVMHWHMDDFYCNQKYFTASFSRTLFLLVLPSRSIPQSGQVITFGWKFYIWMEISPLDGHFTFEGILLGTMSHLDQIHVRLCSIKTYSFNEKWTGLSPGGCF